MFQTLFSNSNSELTANGPEVTRIQGEIHPAGNLEFNNRRVTGSSTQFLLPSFVFIRVHSWFAGLFQRNPIRTFVLLLLTAVAGVAADSGHQHEMAAGQAEVGAQAAFAADGALWAVHRVAGCIAVSRSADDGATWSNPVLVTRTPEPIDAGGDARPKIALGPGGEIYVTWTRPLAEPYTGEIRFSRSLDGGRTFSPPQVVHHDRQIITHRFDTLAVNGKGQVFVAWIDKRDLAAVGGDAKAYVGAAVYFAVSDDGGSTFRGDYKVADHCCECCRIALAARNDGTVTAFWRHIFAGSIRDHAMATLHADGTVTGFRRATFDDWRIDACPHHGPALAVDDGGQVHAVWFSGAPESHGVFYGRIGGDRPKGSRRVGSDAAGHADVAVDGRCVAVAWKEPANGQTRLCGMVSDDGGTTWRECVLGSVNGAADHPRVLVHDHRFVVFWNTAERPLAVIAMQ
jgi:hypothetical protein